MMHSHVSDFPPVFVQTLRKIFIILPFPPTFFLVIDHKFRIVPPIFEFLLYFLCFSIFPPASRKLLFPPTFSNVPLFSKNSRVFYMLYVYFVSPYFAHDAFMHHTMHVMDAPACLGHHHQLSLGLATCTVPPLASTLGCRRRCPICQQAIAH